MDQKWTRRPDSAPKLITEPQVTVKAATYLSDLNMMSQVLDKEYPSFTTRENEDKYGSKYHEDGEYLIEFGGRACYQSFHNPAGRSTDGYLRNIINQGHLSVLEHCNVSFYLEGISRSLTHELIRHRHLSPSQLSQRYVDGSSASYVAPPLVVQDSELFLAWSQLIDFQHKQWMEFQKLIDARHPELSVKERREAARSVAPNATETKMLITGNLRAWREFLPKRWSSHAEAEIRTVAGMIRDHLVELYPSTFDDITYA